jgi:hypothetical protein
MRAAAFSRMHGRGLLSGCDGGHGRNNRTGENVSLHSSSCEEFDLLPS